MKEIKPSLKPQQIDEHTWYYEEEKSIKIYKKVLDVFPTVEIEIPRLKLLNSLSRIYGKDFRRTLIKGE